MEEKVILVDQNDNPLGTMEKMEAHRKGLLHRAFSVFIFNDKGQLLLQQRALSKYHSPGLWTNTVCSHQREGESTEAAAHRRLREEMGFDTEVREIFDFIYRAELDRGLTEHELDHVLIGKYQGDPEPNPGEVAAYDYVYLQDLKEDIRRHPEKYTVWFKIIFDRSYDILVHEAAKMFRNKPLLFEPYFEEKVWGGNKIKEIFGLNSPFEHTGEAWLLSAVPGKETPVRSGFFKGMTLSYLWQILDSPFWGDYAGKEKKDFPLLLKIIDAKRDLSVQVHPDDDTAREKHNGFGKNEMWRILDAGPGSVIYAGLKEGVTREDFLQALKGKRLEEILRPLEVLPGDMVFIPAGTVHAIGKGILLAEIQQTSDITYRIYDWNRTGLDGKPRPLHIDEAFEVIQFDSRPDVVRKELKTPYFSVEDKKIDRDSMLTINGFRLLINTSGGIFDFNGVQLSPGQAALLFAGEYRLKPVRPGSLLMIEPK